MRAPVLLIAAAALVSCRGEPELTEPVLPTIIATCAETENDVQVRLPGRPYWIAATTGTVLLANTWLRTGAEGQARIEFATGTHLEVGAKAVVVIDVAPSPDVNGPPLSVVALESGKVQGVVEVADGGVREVVIRTVDGSRAHLAAAGQGPSKYELSRRDDELVLSVLSGDLVISGHSREQRVSEGHLTRLTAHGPSAPERVSDSLPGSPANDPVEDRLLAPADLAQFGYVSAPPNIQLSWRPSDKDARYRVVVAADRELRLKVQVDQDTEGRTLEVTRLTAGDYYWGVFVGGDGEWQPLFARARKLTVVKIPALRFRTVPSIQEWGE